MPPISPSCRLPTLSYRTSIASRPVLDFLVPALQQGSQHSKYEVAKHTNRGPEAPSRALEHAFFGALARTLRCQKHQGATKRASTGGKRFLSHTSRIRTDRKSHSDNANDAPRERREGPEGSGHYGHNEKLQARSTSERGTTLDGDRRGSNVRPWKKSVGESAMHGKTSLDGAASAWQPFDHNVQGNTADVVQMSRAENDTGRFQRSSELDPINMKRTAAGTSAETPPLRMTAKPEVLNLSAGQEGRAAEDVSGLINRKENFPIADQVNMLQMVRDLEDKLAQAKAKLNRVMSIKQQQATGDEGRAVQAVPPPQRVRLTRDDYKNLVDLYFYSRHTRSSPDNPDRSPTPIFTPARPDHSPNPLFLDDYSFKLSEDFSEPDPTYLFDEDKPYSSPLKQVEAVLKGKQVREVAMMMPFIDCLLDDRSTLSVLFDLYKRLPSPGVAYLPTGVVRLFLQRMSTPFVKTETSMLRYLSIIEDMQQAGLRINVAEWSSAVYLAGRSFGKVTEANVAAAFKLWREMELEAGVQANNVTFNILFDITVRAGKFALSENVLKEMHDRGLRLNRLGRVCLIWYHGLRGDGDGVRKAYHDFVDAGEIVDTLVLNTVIGALLNAREPVAAEQIYARMKDLQKRLAESRDQEESAPAFRRYPGPLLRDETTGKLVLNYLGRMLLNAPRLRNSLPEKHSELQEIMPLTPDMHTFKAFLAYHATTSGDLDTILFFLKDMTEHFKLPMTPVNYMLLFKGFALHGGSTDPDAKWSTKRLDQAWYACLVDLKDMQKARERQTGIFHLKPDSDLPPAVEVEAYSGSKEIEAEQPAPRKKLSAWHEFVLDLAAFPRERRKPIERVHSQLFDDEMNVGKGFESPFFDPQPQSFYAAPEPVYDHEEGEFMLPSPLAAMSLPENALPPLNMASASSTRGKASSRDPSMEMRLNRPLICWLLRAYTTCTSSREKVTEIYNTVRKMWHPADNGDKATVIRVFQRCLRDCDRYAGYRL